MNIWVIITTCIVGINYEERRKDYIKGISSIIKKFNDPKYKVVIVENNSLLKTKLSFYHKTFLDNFGVPVLYTKNNICSKKTINYSIMEMMDIHQSIQHFGIQNDDFIVKVTGRYVIDETSPFVDIVNNIENKPYSAVVRFGQYNEEPFLQKYDMCTTGLIGLKCKYVKQIEIPGFYEYEKNSENQWAKVISKLEDNEICFLEKLGIFYKPGWLNIKDYIYV